jgi:hypothetical protein
MMRNMIANKVFIEDIQFKLDLLENKKSIFYSFEKTKGELIRSNEVNNTKMVLGGKRTRGRKLQRSFHKRTRRRRNR